MSATESVMLLRLWNLLVAVSATSMAITIPLQLVLGYTPGSPLLAFDWMITILFAVDILVNIARPLVSQEQPSQLRTLTLNYLKGWGLVDAIATLPWYWLFGVPLLDLLRFAKLLRVAQLLHQRRRGAVQYNPIFRLSRFVFWLGLSAHWLACGWLALHTLATDMPGMTQYLHALYWCVTTLTTVGYGDVTPTTDAQKVYTMVVMVLGVGVYGYVIGNMANLLANLDLAKAHYLSTMERLTTFMKYRHIPPPLQQRVYDYYTYLWENRLGYDESAVLSELPPTLRTEVSLLLKRDFIEKVPFLKGASYELIRELALELRPVVYTPGDFIVHAGEIGRHMYFISHGTVEVIAADAKTVYGTLRDGDFFGEIALLYSQPRTASVRALDYCDLYTLDKDTFTHAISRYPEFATHMQNMAQKRREEQPPDSPNRPDTVQ
jgi:Cyclic nucleotide-binding domain/Ion channel